MKTCSICKREYENGFRMCPYDGAPLHEAPGIPDAYIGKVLGQCRIIEKICDADLGPIYKAEDPKQGAVALQITPFDRVGSPVLLEAYLDAVKRTVKLNHPNAVRIYGTETAPDGGVAVIMELVSGTDLASYRGQNPNLGFQETLTLVRMIAEGVLAAHRLSIVHGALHPSRILVTPDRNIKVGGFHRSALREGVDGRSATPSNLPYLAPEQVGILQDAAGLDYRTDIFSLGVILYELLTGRLPYNATNIQDFATILEAAPPLDPSFINSTVPPLLSRVVIQALSGHPADRQKSMDQFLRELDVARQPIREPERPPVPVHAEPEYPPSGQDSGLFGPSSRRESKHGLDDSLWHDTGQAKDGAESSMFGWFKTQVAGSKRHGWLKNSRTRHDAEDSGYVDTRGGGVDQDGSEVRTVVVSSHEKGERRSLWGTVTNFTHRDLDETGTGALPRPPIYKNPYLVVPIGAFFIAVIGMLLYFLLTRNPSVTLTIDSEPSHARLWIRPENPPEAPWEYIDETPKQVTKPAGKYRVKLDLDGYEKVEDRPIDFSKTANPRITIGLTQTPLIVVQAPVDSGDAKTAGGGTTTTPVVAAGGDSPAWEQPFRDALSKRNFFPPAENSAWKYIQAQAGNPSPALDRALTAFCAGLEKCENDNVKDRKWQDLRNLMTQIQKYSPDLACANKLRGILGDAQKQCIDENSPYVRAKMDSRNYVTPHLDCAFFYVQSILSCDDTNDQAKMWEQQIFEKAWAQAQGLSKQRHHQDALNIMNELKGDYPNPPSGKDALFQAIDKETQRLDKFNELSKTVIVSVQHPHPKRLWGLAVGGKCSGKLVVSGFEIEYKTDESEHGQKVNYDELTTVNAPEKNKIEIQWSRGKGNTGDIRLEQVDGTSSPNLGEVCALIKRNRELYAQYKKALE